MIEFGNDLKNAREAKGLTIADVAEKTHMMSAMIEDLEHENFNRIVAPIYGRGFVKLYCETIGLDPKPFVEEFMAIYTGSRDPSIRERPTSKSIQATEPAPPPEPEIPAEPVPLHEPLPEPTFAFSEPMPAAETVPEPVHEEAAPAPVPKFTSYSAPLKTGRASELPELGPTLIRWSVLLAGVILVLWALIAGIRALYRATSRPTETAPAAREEVVETSVETTTPAKPIAEPRKPLNVPPLYID